MGDVVIHGRPEFSRLRRHGELPWGVTRARSHPEFVFSKKGALVHRVREVHLAWWDLIEGGTALRRRPKPRMHYVTVCGMHLAAEGTYRNATGVLCAIPNPEATHCGRCNGKRPTFARDGRPVPNRRKVAANLGCVAVTE